MDTRIITEADYKYYVATPDSSFSPQRNKAIIAETIRKTEKFFTDMVTVMDHEMGNRIDILSSYGRYRFNKGDKKFRQYAGDKLYKDLIGEKILQRVRVMDTVNKMNNNRKYSNFIQL